MEAQLEFVGGVLGRLDGDREPEAWEVGGEVRAWRGGEQREDASAAGWRRASRTRLCSTAAAISRSLCL